jgi:WD40 repeat protein
MLASGGADGEIKLWDLRKMKCVKSTQATPNRRQLSAVEVVDVDAICTSLKQSHQEIDEQILKSICSDVIMISHDRYNMGLLLILVINKLL